MQSASGGADRMALQLLQAFRAARRGAGGARTRRLKKVTLQIIADETGLSKFAVSRALAGKSGVSAATRLRVTETADRLGYRRNTGVAANVLGAIFDDQEAVNSELYMQIQSGAQREATRLGYGMRLSWTHSPEDASGSPADCAGLLIVGQHTAQSLARAYATGTPIVRSGWLDPLQQADCGRRHRSRGRGRRRRAAAGQGPPADRLRSRRRPAARPSRAVPRPERRG